MRRIHAFEIHDSPHCPAAWREGLVDFLSFFARTFRPYEAIAGRLWEAINQAGATRLVDLCSGAGAPALTVQRALRGHGLAIPLVLTDKYPHPGAGLERFKAGGSDLHVVEEPVDATAVPKELQGFRTLFTAFHHFPPAQARGILDDAAEQGQGIGIFEYTERNFLVWGPALLLTPIVIWIATPFMRPFRLSRLLWTYLLPVLPFIAVWDGLVSCLRTYSPAELESLKDSVDRPDYRWEIGRIRSFGGCRITYLLGWPERAA
jgi:hypothetical protein